jgi:glyoxylase-like metal-dependent hydrolase (beta-lactamase superfamily II)
VRRRRLWSRCALAAALLAGCRATLDEAAPEAVTPPPPAQGHGLKQVCWIETASSFGFTGSSLLVRHADGDLLIDAGASSRFDEEIEDHPFATRWHLALVQGPLAPSPRLPEALRAAGEEPERVRRVIVTHAHGDHLGGLGDLASAPGFLAPEELAWIATWEGHPSFHALPALARRLAGRLSAVPFVDARYEIFAKSWDVYGDGRVIVVPLFGHTPGSLGVIVNARPDLRVFHVGDAAHDVAGIDERLEKPFITRDTDVDPTMANQQVARLARLHREDPTLTFLPAHDRAQWARIFGAPSRCVEADAR